MDDLHVPCRTTVPYGLVTDLPPETAFARAAVHLMGKPAFARAPFGHIARMLAGQVNRRHYAFACRGEAIVGLAGWALVQEPAAEAWLAGRSGFSDAEAGSGDCAVLNVWQADSPEVTRFMMVRLLVAVPARRIYAKRHYPDGRIRPVRLDSSRRQASANH